MFCLRISILAFSLIAPAAANAQANCAARDHVVNKLETSYGEAFSGGGLQNAESVFEVWSNEDEGTWTILMTKSDGKTCIMASGTNWREGDGVKVPKGIPG